MILLIIQREKQRIKWFLFLNKPLKLFNRLHLRMLIFTSIGNSDDRWFISWLCIESIKWKLFLLKEGDIPFETNTIHSEIASNIEITHNLFPQLEYGMIASQSNNFFLSLHNHNNINISMKWDIQLDSLPLNQLKKTINSSQAYLRILF